MYWKIIDFYRDLNVEKDLLKFYFCSLLKTGTIIVNHKNIPIINYLIMKFNKSLILGAAISALTITSGIAQVQQDSSKTNEKSIAEYGFGLYNLNSFSLQYRIGTEKRVTRLTGNFSINNSQNITTPKNGTTSTYSNTKIPINVNLGFNVAYLTINKINDHFGFQKGPQFGSSFGILETNTSIENTNTSNYYKAQLNNETKSFSLNFGYVLGFYYKFNQSFFLYGEVVPTISYINSLTNSSKEETDNNKITTKNDNSTSNKHLQLSGLSNSGAMISLVYRLNQ